MIYGIHPVLEALNAGKEFDRVFIHHGARGDGIQQVRRMLREKQIAFQEVPVEKLNRLTLKNHQDIIAFISPISYQPLEEVVTRVFEQGMTPLVLLLDRITDVRNFGAIARTAECAGVHALVIPNAEPPRFRRTRSAPRQARCTTFRFVVSTICAMPSICSRSVDSRFSRPVRRARPFISMLTFPSRRPSSWVRKRMAFPPICSKCVINGCAFR